MYTFITVLIVITCVLIVLVVLVQSSKGGGLASGFASSAQVMGVRKTTDFLEKLTWGLAITLILLSMLSNFALPKKGESEGRSSALQEKIENYSAPVGNIPNIPAPSPANNAVTPKDSTGE